MGEWEKNWGQNWEISLKIGQPHSDLEISY